MVSVDVGDFVVVEPELRVACALCELPVFAYIYIYIYIYILRDAFVLCRIAPCVGACAHAHNAQGCDTWLCFSF